MLQSSGVSPTRGAKRPGPRGIPVPVPGAWLFSALQLWIGQSDRCAHRITRQKGLLKLTPPLRHRTDPEGISFKRAIEASAKIDDHGQGHTHGDQAVQRLRVRARLPEAAAARREDGPHEMAVPDDDGRLTWHYLADDEAAKEWPQSYADKYDLGLPLVCPQRPPVTRKPSSPSSPANVPAGPSRPPPREKPPRLRAQWPRVLREAPAPVGRVGLRVRRAHVPHPRHHHNVVRHADAHTLALRHRDPQLPLRARNPEDGGWGLHIEGESSVFGTAMNYVALRLVGVDAEDPVMVKARGTLHKLGGALYGPHWSKFWLAVLGIVDWDLVNPVPAEVWLLPTGCPSRRGGGGSTSAKCTSPCRTSPRSGGAARRRSLSGN